MAETQQFYLRDQQPYIKCRWDCPMLKLCPSTNYFIDLILMRISSHENELHVSHAPLWLHLHLQNASHESVITLTDAQVQHFKENKDNKSCC